MSHMGCAPGLGMGGGMGGPSCLASCCGGACCGASCSAQMMPGPEDVSAAGGFLAPTNTCVGAGCMAGPSGCPPGCVSLPGPAGSSPGMEASFAAGVVWAQQQMLQGTHMQPQLGPPGGMGGQMMASPHMEMHLGGLPPPPQRGGRGPTRGAPSPEHSMQQKHFRIYVAGLDDGADPEKLRGHFQQFGGVVDVYLPKNYASGRSQPFGFVTFTDAAGFNNALSSEAACLFGGARIAISVAQASSQPVLARPHCFPHWPHPTVPMSHTPSPPPLSFDEQPKHGERLLPMLQMGSGQQRLPQVPMEPNSPLGGQLGRETTRLVSNERLFVGKLTEALTESALQSHFEQFGQISDVYLPKAYHSGLSQGFGFVTFSAPGAVALALDAGPHLIGNVELEVKRAEPRGAHPALVQPHPGMAGQPPPGPRREASERLFVGRLPEIMTEGALRGYFEQFGAVSDVYLPKEYQSGRPQGFGFITFSAEGAVAEVLKAGTHVVEGVKLEVKRAKPKEEGGRGGRGRGMGMALGRGHHHQQMLMGRAGGLASPAAASMLQLQPMQSWGLPPGHAGYADSAQGWARAADVGRAATMCAPAYGFAPY